MNRSNIKTTLMLSAMALFFLSFLASGNSNALPQVFFQRHYPEQKTLLLSVTLLADTIAAIAGIFISRRVRSRRLTTMLLLGLIITAVEALLYSDNAMLFIPCLVLVQFSENWLFNQIDHAAVASAGELRGFNDGLGTFARLLGMLCAPAFFTFFADQRLVEQIVVAVLATIAMAGCWRLFRDERMQTKTQTSQELIAPTVTDRLLFVYAITVYASLYLFSANMIYLLKDLFHMPGAETRGGGAIVTVFLAALITNAILSMNRLSSRATKLRVAELAFPALTLVSSAVLILAKVQIDYPLCLAAGAAIGVSYGAFLWQVRDYASSAARQGKTALLSWFNNLANLSALIAFGMMTAIASDGTYYLWLMAMIVAMLTVGLILLAVAAMLAKTEQTGR
ncbi:MAG: hypothetical protein ACXWF8_06360 [Methylobacter sp.]